MSEVSKIVVQAGLVDGSVVSELKRWGSPVEVPEGVKIEPEAVPLAIERALQEDPYIQVRETDLEILQLYLRSQRSGIIHFEPMTGDAYEFEITYGMSRLGEFIVPWTAEDIIELMTNGATYLMHAGTKVFMKDARELFYGNKKAFMICTPDNHERG